MLRFGKSSVFVLAATMFYAAPAHAQATRTWVSGVGDDANPCSRTAPCKTFAGAISKTAAGGEINCLDPGGFGGVTITKALSIVCNYTEGGVLSAGAGVNGIIVNAGVNDHVYLRGLDLHGAGSAQNGVRFLAGAALTIEDSIIRSYNASNGLGISFQPSGSSRLTINNTTINNNGNGATGGGILLQPTGAGTVHATFTNVRITNNANNAFRVDTTGNTGAGIIFAMENVTISGSVGGISVNTPAGTTGVVGLVNNATIVNNTGTGIGVTGAIAVLRVGNSTITDNATGISPGTSQINSFGNNRLIGNPVGGANNGSFTGGIIPPA